MRFFFSYMMCILLLSWLQKCSLQYAYEESENRMQVDRTFPLKFSLLCCSGILLGLAMLSRSRKTLEK